MLLVAGRWLKEMHRRVTWVFIFTMVMGAIHFVVHDARLTSQYLSSVSVANVAHEDRVHYGTGENLLPQTKEIGRKRIKVENGVAGVAQITAAAGRLKVTPNTTQPPSITFATLINSSPAPSTFPTQQSMQRPPFQWSQLQIPSSLPWYQSDVKVKPEQIMQFRWVRKLWSFVTTVDCRFPIAIVASNSKYTDALLNWLIASVVKLKDPIKNILVLSLDSSLQNLLRMRRIDFLYVLPSTLANIKHSKHEAIKQVEVVRLTVMRILNHWGFDVVNYDSDAVILRNPQPIYDRYPGSDVIGSAGTFPNEIYIKWGVTVCMGVVMIRATNRTGIQCFSWCIHPRVHGEIYFESTKKTIIVMNLYFVTISCMQNSCGILSTAKMTK